MRGERLIIKETRDRLSRKINRGDFLKDDAKSLILPKRDFDDVARF